MLIVFEVLVVLFLLGEFFSLFFWGGGVILLLVIEFFGRFLELFLEERVELLDIMVLED